MHRFARYTAFAGAVGLASLAAPTLAGADPAPGPFPFHFGAADAVFVQTDNPGGNQVVAYHRNADGTLVGAGVYSTGGLGGVLNGSQVDHLASQGSLTYDPTQDLLYAVNAGSNSVFRLLGTG